jgi:hypothetical protein
MPCILSLPSQVRLMMMGIWMGRDKIIAMNYMIYPSFLMKNE